MIGDKSLREPHTTRYWHRQAVDSLFAVREELAQVKEERDYWQDRAEQAELEREAWQENHAILAEHYNRLAARLAQPPEGGS